MKIDYHQQQLLIMALNSNLKLNSNRYLNSFGIQITIVSQVDLIHSNQLNVGSHKELYCERISFHGNPISLEMIIFIHLIHFGCNRSEMSCYKKRSKIFIQHILPSSGPCIIKHARAGVLRGAYKQ